MTSTDPGNSGTREPYNWLTPWRFAALFAVLITVCFPGVIFGLETFFYRDFSNFGFPLAQYHRESFWRGELPLWNPYSNCGLPFLAQWNTLTLYPPSVFYLIFPASWSLGVFCFLHMLLGAMGMYFLAYRWTGNRLAAAIAGVIFGFNGLTWHSLMWPNNISAFGWMPWVILAAERAWREGGSRIVIAALVGAIQMVAGAPEAIIVTWLCTGALWLSEFITGEIPRVRLVSRFLFVPLLVAALAAAQLLPFLDLLRHSQRDTNFGDSDWAMTGYGWANYLVPLYHFHTTPQGPMVQRDQYWTSSYYLGVGAIAFALIAAFRARNRKVWTLLALAAFGIMMAMGDNGPVYTALKRVAPQIGFMRFPIKFVILPTFSIPLLAAFGANWLFSAPLEKWRTERRKFILLTVVLLVTMSGLTWAACNHPLAGDNTAATWHSALGRGVVLCLLLAGVFALRGATNQRQRMMLQIGFVALLLLDLFTHGPSLSPTLQRSVYVPDIVRADLIKDDPRWENVGESRALMTVAAGQKMQWTSVAKPEADFFGHRLAFFGNHNLLDHLAKVDGFFSLYIKEEDEVMKQIYMTTNALTPLKDLMCISHTSNPTNALEWSAREGSMPFVTIGQEPMFADDAGSFRAVTDEKFQPRAQVILPLDARSSITATRQSDAKARFQRVSPQHLDIETESPAPAMVVVSQAFYHPWQVYVDGTHTTVWRANHAFQAFQVPAGKHTVKLVYEDRALMVGAGISLFTLAGCAVVWIRGRRAKTI